MEIHDMNTTEQDWKDSLFKLMCDIKQIAKIFLFNITNNYQSDYIYIFIYLQ